MRLVRALLVITIVLALPAVAAARPTACDAPGSVVPCGDAVLHSSQAGAAGPDAVILLAAVLAAVAAYLVLMRIARRAPFQPQATDTSG